MALLQLFRPDTDTRDDCEFEYRPAGDFYRCLVGGVGGEW